MAALVVAVAALAIALWSFLSAPATDEDSDSSAATAAPDPAAQAEAKDRVCGAFDLVRTAVSLQTNANLGEDPVARQTVAANARLAALGGGQFLLSELYGEVPTDISDEVGSFAHNLSYIGMSQLAGTTPDDPAQVGRLNDAQATATRISELCGAP